jgi:hypothetical protein
LTLSGPGPAYLLKPQQHALGIAARTLRGMKLPTLRLLRNAPAKSAGCGLGRGILPEAASAQFPIPPNFEIAQKSSVFASGIGYSLSLKYFS